MKRNLFYFLATAVSLLVSDTIAAEPEIINSIRDKETNFKIITYNVWVGYHDGEHSRFPCYPSGIKRKEGIYEWLKDQEPDVVVFQELMDYTADKLREESGYWGHNYTVTLRDKGMAIGISSRYPIDVKEILTEGMHHGLIYCNRKGIDIIGTHLWPSFDETILNEAKVVGKRVMKSFKEGNAVIVLGDFNAFSPEDDPFIDQETITMYKKWNWELENGRPSYRVMQYFLDLGLKDVCTKFTKNNEARNMRYDYILASPGLIKKCTDATHIQDKDFLKLSDHFPVVAEFAR
jgi:exodeoxyribonuclease III